MVFLAFEVSVINSTPEGEDSPQNFALWSYIFAAHIAVTSCGFSSDRSGSFFSSLGKLTEGVFGGNMSSKCSAVLLNVLFLVRALSAHECTPCNLRTCPAKAPHGCEGGRILARDPCGCCDQCARLEWEPCGGQDWAHGYCALGLTCASFNTTGAATIPEIGVCKGG